MKKTSRSVSFYNFSFPNSNSNFLDIMDLLREKFPDTFQDPKVFDANQNLSEMLRHGKIFW